MRLREYLHEFTKVELLELAKSFELRRYSSLRKAELIDKIVDHFFSDEIMRSRMVCLTKEQLDLFRKASRAPIHVSIHEVVDTMILCQYFLGGFDESDDFYVYEDVIEAFHKIEDEEFKAEQYEKGWLVKCVQFARDYYGIAPIEVVHEMYRLKVRATVDEMIDRLLELPMDIARSFIIPMDMLGLGDFPQDDPLYSERGLLVDLTLMEEENDVDLISQQMGKDFYVPSVQQIDEIHKLGYEASSIAYKRLEKFLMKRLSLPYEQAISWCLQVWVSSYEEESPATVVEHMTEENIAFHSQAEMEEFMGILISAYNSTRIKENRGHKPEELASKEFDGRIPTIVPGSTEAAQMLRDAEPWLQAHGIPFDLEQTADIIPSTFYPNGIHGETIRTERKIYPNDPCICGSGKKYKKCCGKNR